MCPCNSKIAQLISQSQQMQKFMLNVQIVPWSLVCACVYMHKNTGPILWGSKSVCITPPAAKQV